MWRKSSKVELHVDMYPARVKDLFLKLVIKLAIIGTQVYQQSDVLSS